MNVLSTNRARKYARTCAGLALVACVVFAPLESAGQDMATRSAARKLGEEGIALFDKEQWAAALEKFNLADQLVPQPTLAIRAARCLVKLGRLVEASERYLQIERTDLTPAQQTPVHRKAKADAIKEREELAPLIPSLTIEVTGPVGSGITVFVDKQQVPTAMLGQKRPIDPGPHEVEVRRGETKVKKSVDLLVKTNEKVTLVLPPLPKPKPPEPDPFWRAMGWVGIGVGAGGVVAFAVNGGLALAKTGELSAKCPNRVCPPEHFDDVDLHDTLQYATTAGIVAGVVGFGVGVPLLLFGPKKKTGKEGQRDTTGATWEPVVSPGSFGVRGTF